MNSICDHYFEFNGHEDVCYLRDDDGIMACRDLARLNHDEIVYLARNEPAYLKSLVDKEHNSEAVRSLTAEILDNI